MRTDRLQARLSDLIEQMSQNGARALQRDLRARNLAHQQARRRLQARHMTVGKVVDRAGLWEWTPEQVLGLLLHAHESNWHSPTMRLAFEKRGRAAMRGGRDPPSSPTQEPDESTVSE